MIPESDTKEGQMYESWRIQSQVNTPVLSRDNRWRWCGVAGSRFFAWRPGGASVPQALPELPSLVLIDHEGTGFRTSQRQGSTFAEHSGKVVLTHTPAGQEVRVLSVAEPLCRVVMRWKLDFPEDTLYLGDAWERGYGDLQWRFLQPERVMPWYFAAHRTGNDTSWPE